MIEQVLPSQLGPWFERTPTAQRVVLDVREPWEVKTASVRPDGFALVAIPMNEIPGRLGELDPDKSIACLCHHGARSQHVAAFLAGHGFTNVVNLAGGIDAWSVQVDAAVPRY